MHTDTPGRWLHCVAGADTKGDQFHRRLISGTWEALRTPSLGNWHHGTTPPLRATHTMPRFYNILQGNKYNNDNNRASDCDSGSIYQINDDPLDACDTHKEIPLHFKISTQRSDEEILTNVFQRSLAEQMERQWLLL